MFSSSEARSVMGQCRLELINYENVVIVCILTKHTSLIKYSKKNFNYNSFFVECDISFTHEYYPLLKPEVLWKDLS